MSEKTETISEFNACDFKIINDGKEVEVTKAEYDPIHGGYLIEWKE